MSEVEKIYVDVSQPATLRYGTKSVDCPPLGEAVLAFDRLPEGDREQATIKVNAPGGATYTAEEIDRLHVAPKKKYARRGAAHHGQYREAAGATTKSET